MSQKEIICVGCPMGCNVRLNIDGTGAVIDTTGNECKQGKKYAKQEYENPVRVFTATVLTKGSARALLPVRTNAAIPKAKLKECARFLAAMTVEPGLKVGDVVVENIIDTGSDLICSAELQG